MPTKDSSIWLDEKIEKPQKLTKNLKCDVCIVGAGIAGLSCAYFLKKEGKNVIVVDKSFGQGETAHTSAHLATALDDRYYNLESIHGKELTKLAAESHSEAINIIEKIAKNNADFERVDGYLLGNKEDLLEKEKEAALRAGLDVQLVDSPVHDKITPCLKFKDQAVFHPVKYLNILKKDLELYQATVKDIEENKVITDTFTIEADNIILATNTPINTGLIHVKQAPYTSYVLGLTLTKAFPNILLWDGYWEKGVPYHYVRIYNNVLIVGGEDHKTGQGDPKLSFAKLEAWAKKTFPVKDIKYKWSGMIMESYDGLAFIGLNPGSKNTYIVTGDSGNGLTHGTIAGLLITDLIMKRKSKWEEVYDPSRTRFKATKEILKESLNVAKQYTDHLKTPKIEDANKLRPDTGAIISEDGRKIAAYKDKQGKITKCSAVCTHMGCLVKFNNSEKTWDCPCHGSRFTTKGKVIHGPAIKELEQIESMPSREQDSSSRSEASS